MKELSLNILDISENSAKAKASLIEIIIEETDGTLVIKISDDGVGMPEEVVNSVTNPFYTTRTTRSVGLGIPFLKLAAEQTGGSLDIRSVQKTENGAYHGTVVTARFNKNHIDFTPLGDCTATVTTLIMGHPEIDFLYIHKKGEKEVRLDTRELRAVLEDVPLDTYEVILWIKDNLTEQYNQI